MRLVGTVCLWILSLLALLVSAVAGFAAMKAPYAPALWAAVAAGLLFALFVNPLFAARTRLRGQPGRRWGLVALAFVAGLIGAGFSFDEMFSAPARIANEAIALVEKHPGDKAAAEQAASLYRIACDERAYEACYNLALLHDLNGPLAKDPALSGPLYDNACGHEVPVACLNRGRQYYVGDGVQADLERARSLYAKACDAKINEGCDGVVAVDTRDFMDKKPGGKARLLADFKHMCETGNKDACTAPQELEDLLQDDDDTSDGGNSAAANSDSGASAASAVAAKPASSATPAATHAPAPVSRTASPSGVARRRAPHRPPAPPAKPSAWVLT